MPFQEQEATKWSTLFNSGKYALVENAFLYTNTHSWLWALQDRVLVTNILLHKMRIIIIPPS